jgi:phytoene dehydrogenase-like protein
MTHEVVVVGAGVGGLTCAALLAARGLDVCVLEKESQGGGCATTFERFGYEFETTAGLYAGWGAGDIHARVFAELHPTPAPETRRLSPAYIVRLPDGTEVRVGGSGSVQNDESVTSDESDESVSDFETKLSVAFPECAAAAINFYRELTPIAETLQRSARRAPALATLSKFQRMRLMASEARHASRILALQRDTAAQHLSGASPRFRRFVDAQLQMFAGCASDECAYLHAAVALNLPRRGLYSIRGGAAALTRALAVSIKASGGTLRFDTTALRLAFDAGGRATGVTLLNGETVAASRAVVSNLTVWDTYGKLVGLSRTPETLRERLKHARGWGAYLLYLGADDDALRRLPAAHILALDSWPDEHETYDAASAGFMFSASPAWDTQRAPAGKRAVTVSLYTDVNEWFAFHTDESEHEAQDQKFLEATWERLHAALPELGAGVEVIETATPRTFYEATRRKLGMVGGLPQTLSASGAHAFTHRTPFPNLFLTGDTTFPGNGLAAVTHSALIVANEIAPRK